MTAVETTATLEQCESVIARGLNTFVEVGNALLTIRDGRLYRDSHATFEAYCSERWGFSKTHANRLVEAASVVAELAPIGVTVANEGQARELAGLDAETAADVIRHAESIGDGKVTAAVIREARREVVAPEVQQLADDLVAHDATFTQIADELRADFDDEPPLTDDECRALADPADLDDTPLTEEQWRAEGTTPSTDSVLDAIDRRDPSAKGDRSRANLRAGYSRNLAGVTGLCVLDPEQVASVLSDTEVNVLEGIARQISAWAGKVAAVKRRTGLSVVNGGRL